MTKSGARLIRSGAEFRTTPLNYTVNLWSTAPHDPNFLTDPVQRSGWSIVARQIIALPYCFIPYLPRRKWGLWKYWSLQSIQSYLYTKRVLATFFPCYYFSSRAVKISGGRTRWRYLEGKTAKHRQQTTTVSVSHHRRPKLTLRGKGVINNYSTRARWIWDDR